MMLPPQQRILTGLLVLAAAAGSGGAHLGASATGGPTGSAPRAWMHASGEYEDLVALHGDFTTFRLSAPRQQGVSDWSPAAMRARLETIREFQQRLARIGPADWPVSQQVDYLVVRSIVDQQAFLHVVSRPWARDPGFYVDQLLRITFVDLPLQGQALEDVRTRLASVPVLLDRARANLTDPAADYVALALHNLQNADGVGHGHPYRSPPPAGVGGWYEDLLERARHHQPEIVDAVSTAGDAVQRFRRWLLQNRQSWTAEAGVGRANFDWHLKYVKYLPLDADDVVRLAKREFDRLTSFYAFERHRNAELPELEPATSAQEYQRRIDDADEHIRGFIRDRNMLTIPDYIGQLSTNVPWIVRPGGRNFWEEIQYRDPRPDHVHAVIPGHGFDGEIARRSQHPIRGGYAEGARVEGWAYYLEEMFLQNGLLDDRPRTRELYYAFGIKRAVRVPAEVNMHLNRFSVQQATDYMVERVPFLDADVARVDAEIYLRRPPGYGLGYLIGGLEISKLAADRYRQLGAQGFRLGEFHDEYLAAGRIPTSLIRWEMTGLDDEVAGVWRREPIPEPY